VLIPLVYLRYHFQDAWREARDLDSYLLRSLLAGAFSGKPHQLIYNLLVELRSSRRINLNEVFCVLRSANRSLELTEDRLWEMGYGSDNIHLLFNLWYREFHYTPTYRNNLPQVDHIFPQSVLRKVKQRNPSTGRMDMMRYREQDRNQLANCMLLTAQENGAGGKWDTPPDQWFVGERATDSYLSIHLIPPDPALWKLERFEDFVAERKKLIAEKFRSLLVSTDRQAPINVTPIVQLSSDRRKTMARLIDAGLVPEQSRLILRYRGQEFIGRARRDGIELTDGVVYSPSAAATRCYAEVGSTRPTENGWVVWRDTEERTLTDLFNQLQPAPPIDDLLEQLQPGPTIDDL